MKIVISIFLFALVACAMSQALSGAYNYGYNTYTPGARVSHYSSSSGIPLYAPSHAYGYGYNTHAAPYPYVRYY